MKLVFASLLLIATLVSSAQTRRIALRFHSGSDYKMQDFADGNYGIPMPHKASPNLHVVIDSIRKDDGTIYYRWDTIDNSSPAGLNVTRHKRIARMCDLGNICTTLTTR